MSMSLPYPYMADQWQSIAGKHAQIIRCLWLPFVVALLFIRWHLTSITVCNAADVVQIVMPYNQEVAAAFDASKYPCRCQPKPQQFRCLTLAFRGIERSWVSRHTFPVPYCLCPRGPST